MTDIEIGNAVKKGDTPGLKSLGLSLQVFSTL